MASPRKGPACDHARQRNRRTAGPLARGEGGGDPRGPYPRYNRRMVCRDAKASPRSAGEKQADACRAVPAGGSPVPVGAGAPGSRPPAAGESPRAEAGRQEPLRREQARGPQHQVKPAASTDEQSGSRAAHVTAKATITARESGWAGRSGGVEGAARDQGTARNTRGPSAQPQSRQSGSYKPEAKASAAQRESEGIKVAKMAVKKNAAGARGPCSGSAVRVGKREGMAGKTGPNHPLGQMTKDKVRELQRRLWSVAKQQPKRRFHALYDRICRTDILQMAWERTKANKGAAGVDGETLAAVEQHGVEKMLEELRAKLSAGTYRPAAVLRRYIPKADGRKRPLGIPTVKDRVVQTAAKLLLEPIFEADFKSTSYGFRPKRSATQALETLRKRGARGGNHVFDADIRDYFGSIDQEKLMKLVERHASLHDGSFHS